MFPGHRASVLTPAFAPVPAPARGRPAKPMFPAPGLSDEGSMSLKAAAAFLCLSVSMVRVLVARGEFEVIHVGRKPLLLKRQLVEWLERKREEARQRR